MTFSTGGVGTKALVSRLDDTSNSVQKSFSRLSSGKRINSASDDAAGLAIAAALNSQAAVLDVAQRNTADAQSLSDIQSGVYASVSDIGTRVAELAAQSANGTLSDAQRTSINQESQALSQEAQRQVATAQFNGVSVFSGQSFQVGTTGGSESAISTPNSDISTQVAALSTLDLSTQGGGASALDSANAFIGQVSRSAGETGAVYSRLDSASSLISTQREGVRAAESRISDADIGEEASTLTRKQIQQQVNIASINQSLKAQQGVLNLLA